MCNKLEPKTIIKHKQDKISLIIRNDIFSILSLVFSFLAIYLFICIFCTLKQKEGDQIPVEMGSIVVDMALSSQDRPEVSKHILTLSRASSSVLQPSRHNTESIKL